MILAEHVHACRASRARGLFLHCVILGRVMKLLFILPDRAPRVVTSCDDLIAMLADQEWASAADSGLEAAAAGVVACEPACTTDAPAQRRRQSRLGTGRVRAGVATRDPLSLLMRAVDHLESRGAVHLTTFLLPSLLVVLDTAIWLATQGSDDIRLVEKVFPTVLLHLKSAGLIFPRQAKGLAVLAETAFSWWYGNEKNKPSAEEVSDKLLAEAKVNEEQGCALVQHRLTMAAAIISKNKEHARKAEDLENSLKLIPLAWSGLPRRFSLNTLAMPPPIGSPTDSSIS